MNFAKNRNLSFAAAAAILLTAGTARAQVCVNPAGGGCQTTIQAGVDVATAGQTVTLAPAVYSETVEIPPGKDGLVLAGGGATIDNGSTDNAIVVLSNDVTLTGLTIRNSKTGVTVGDDLLVYPTGTVLSGMTFLSTENDSVSLLGADDTSISGCTCRGSGDSCISAEYGGDAAGSDNVTVTDSRFFMTDSRAVIVDGDGAVLRGNRFELIEDGPGIEISGDNAVVDGNSVYRSQAGFYVMGANPKVTKNKVTTLAGEGYEVICTSNCASGATVSGNKATNVMDDRAAYLITGDEAGLVVDKNSSVASSWAAFEINGTGVIVTGNKASNTGGRRETCAFDVTGDHHELTGNTATGSAFCGFSVTGSNQLLQENVASRSHGDGFYVYSDNNPLSVTLKDNTASGSTGESFAVGDEYTQDTSGVTLTGNTSVGGRAAYCEIVASTAHAVDGGGNSFALAAPPECAIRR